MTKLMLIAGILGLGACVDGTPPAEQPSENIARTVADTEHITATNTLALPATVDQVFDARAHENAQRVEICDLQPQDGPCALACDPNVLGREYVPEGMCMLFLCETSLGEPVKVGACNQ